MADTKVASDAADVRLCREDGGQTRRVFPGERDAFVAM